MHLDLLTLPELLGPTLECIVYGPSQFQETIARLFRLFLMWATERECAHAGVDRRERIDSAGVRAPLLTLDRGADFSRLFPLALSPRVTQAPRTPNAEAEYGGAAARRRQAEAMSGARGKRCDSDALCNYVGNVLHDIFRSLTPFWSIINFWQ